MPVSQPTLASGATSITLPYPSNSSSTRSTWDSVGGSRLTANGTVRVWSIGYRYTYTLAFEYAASSTYDSIVALYWDNVNAQSSTTFTWSGGPWSSADTGVEVYVDSISPLVTTYPDTTKGDFIVTLVEVQPRTS